MEQNPAFEMEKVFAPQQVEDAIYQKWEARGYFTPDVKQGGKPFSVMMPPPNITGQLHMGHALDTTNQDVLTRYHRMLGENTLWLPGTDHASIATEVKIVEQMAEEGLTKEDLGREKFLERAWAWREQYGRRIVEQLRKLGASCDWSRERFTMDDGLSRAVEHVFIKLYSQDLIYRGERIINWCPVCKTALSDAEVEHEEQSAHLWHFRYPREDGSYIVVATTRPETVLGDTGVAVNPADARYADFVGKTVTLPLMDREIPVVADEYVDMEFGTGAVKMTPAHDPNDFEVAQRHNLPLIRVINDDGTMNERAGRFAGMTREECRKAVIKAFDELGLLEKIEPLTHNVGTCYRCKDTVEPLASTQWFVRMAPLAEKAIQGVREGDVEFVPERFAKTYYNWMENIRDWCISRQLWWGHRIPAYHCTACGEITVAEHAPDACPKCGGSVVQDQDVLDTWFSSALWPFSTLGWPDKTEDLAFYYPTSVLVTGYDIIFFWVARMIFSGYAHMGERPFDKVLIHGLVRDAQGRKMSKSLGNGIDPLEMIEKYGADALRFSLLIGVAPGNDMRFSEEKAQANRNFANKVWNAARFVLMNVQRAPGPFAKEQLALSDKWILSRYQEAVRGVTGCLDQLDLSLAVQRIYDFIWDEYCDWYIELAKPRLAQEGEDGEVVRGVLLHVLDGMLKLLHPFMPFLTEAVYQNLPVHEETIMLSSWPKADPDMEFARDAQRMQGVMEIIRAVRNLRAETKVAPGRKARLILRPMEGWQETLSQSQGYFLRLASASEVAFLRPGEPAPEQSLSAVTEAAELFLPLGDLVDVEKELARLEKERETLKKEIARAEAKLSNEGFLQKAPEALVHQEREKLQINKAMLSQLEARAASLESLQ